MKYLFDRKTFLIEAVLHKHYIERSNERININNISLKIEGVDSDKVLPIKEEISKKILLNIEKLKNEKNYPIDNVVRIIKTGSIKIRKDNKDLNINMKTKSKSGLDEENEHSGNVYWSICINNIFNTILLSNENEEDILYAKTRGHLKYKDFPDMPILMLVDEISSLIVINLDQDNNIIQQEDSIYIDSASKQKALSIGSDLEHIGILMNKEGVIKDEEGKPVKDFKNATIKDIVSLTGKSIKSNTTEQVKDGIKILFNDLTQKTLIVGDKLKIDDKIVTINKIFLDKRMENPVNIMYK